MDAPNVLVLGGSGFIGSHVVAKLAAAGARVVVPTRRYERARHLIFLPRVEVVEEDVYQDGVLVRLTQGLDAVVNLVGALHSRRGMPYGLDFARAHVELPLRVANACAANDVPRFLHMSALGAASNAPSMYLRSKADGELAAMSNPAVAAAVFRPSVVFGPEDRFLNLFATMQKVLPVLPLAGAATRLQPVFVEDVAQAFVNDLSEPQSRNRVYELAGPKVYTLWQLVKLAGLYSGHPRPIVKLAPALATLLAQLLEWLPGAPLMSRDNLASLSVDNVILPSSQALTAADLGIRPHALEAVAPHYLGRVLPRLDEFRRRAGR